MRDIGKNIKQLRVQKNMTQDELAEKLFVTRQTVSNYETGRSRPDVDMLVKIAEVLGTDIQQLIYGPEPKRMNAEVKRLIVGSALTAVFGILWAMVKPVAEILSMEFSIMPELTLFLLIRPLCCFFGGWTTAQLLAIALGRKPLSGLWPRRIGAVLLVAFAICFLLWGWYWTASAINEWQYKNHIRGEWTEVVSITADGKEEVALGWSKLPTQVPDWVVRFTLRPMSSVTLYQLHPFFMAPLGCILWLCGIPVSRKKA